MSQSNLPMPMKETEDKSVKEVKAIPIGDTEAEIAMLLFLNENPQMNFAAKRRSDFPADILWAAKYGFTKGVKYLIDKGADLTVIHNTVSGGGRSCLHYAAQAEGGNLRIIELLVEGLGLSKINEYRDFGGCTVLHYAARSPDESIICFLLEKGADVKAVTNTGHTPLHIAASRGNGKIIGMFIDKGADLNANTNIGFTPLMYAAEAGNAKAVMKLLNTRQVDLETKGIYSGKTALHLAVEGGHLGSVERLVGFGADIYSRNLLGKRAADYTLEDLPRECINGEVIMKLINHRAT